MATEKVFTDTEICLKAVDEFEVLYDAREEHLVRKSSSTVTFTTNPEAFQSLNKCQKVLLMCLKQRIILNEPVVRFHHKNDISDLQAKIVETGLPNDVYEAVRDISKEGYITLKDAGLLDVLVEFDAERLANVVAFDKTMKMAGYFDMLAMLEDADPEVKSRKGRDGTEKHKKIKKSKPSKLSKKSSNSVQKQTNSDSNFDDLDSDELDEVKTNSDHTISARNLGRAVVTVAMTARNQVPALDIYRQLLFSHIHTLSKFYILVFHVGPLVEQQEVVLYEYKVPKILQKWLKNVKACENEFKEKGEIKACGNSDNEHQENSEKVTIASSDFYVSLTVQKTNHLGPLDSKPIAENRYLNINNLEGEFRSFYGKQLQQLSPFKDYFRYVVYDVPGIKDHQKDNKARYARYMDKQERKKKMLRTKKEEQKTEEEKIEEACETSRTMVSSKLGEVGSIMGVLDRLDETNNVSFLEKLEERLEELNSDTQLENSNADNDDNDDTDNDADITAVNNIDGMSVIDMLRDRDDFEDYEPDSSIVCLPSSASEDGSCSAWISKN